MKDKIKNYLAAAGMLVFLFLIGLFLFRVSVYGIRYVLNGYPDCSDMPALGKLLTAKDFKTCYIAYIREVPHEPHYDSLEIAFEHKSFCDPDVLIREALEIREITERYMREHPEDIDSEMRVRLKFHDENDASPAYVCFLNYDENKKGRGFQSGGLMYGRMCVPGASLETLKDARGFTVLQLDGFVFPSDFSALNDMDTLQSLSFQGEQKYYYEPEVLADFAQHHPGCELSGSIGTKDENDHK